jgi:hypothetical protein
MKSILDRYLDRVLVYANQPEPKAETIRKELKDHLLQKVDDLAKTGLSREEATLEALRQHGSPRVIGYKLRGAFPWIDIRSHGTARGVIAIGPRAVGIFAFGGIAVGVVACAPLAIGLFSAGFLAIGLAWAWAFLAAGGIATSFVAIGVIATGWLAIGLVVDGDTTIGAWVPYPGHASFSISHYTAENVPQVLRSLESLLHGCAVFDQYAIQIFLPAYLLLILAPLNYLKYREGKRVASADDWLIDG